MASFTSSNNISFTPYIETNPVDAYLRVGLYKEQQLQEGIQKVQASVDAITGLPIIKEEDRQYVQNKLGQLKSGISKNLSGDFSDARITNQIAGAAKTIYSDPVVQNSVQGTMSYKKGLADIEEAKKNGKWNIANETVFQDGVNAWLSDKTAGSKASQYFTGYTPYTDVNEMFLKYWKEVDPTDDLSSVYYNDPKNITPTNPTGRTISPTMFEGKSAAQVKAVWDLVKGNANAQQQLQIDGQYQFRGQTPEQIYAQLGAQTKASIDENNAAILALQAKAAVGDKDAAAEIAQLQKLNLDSEKSLSNYAQALQTNPDAVKGAIASQRTLSSLIGAYTSQKLKKSDLWETSFQENKFRIETEQWQRTFDQNERKFAWDQQMDQLNYSLAVDKQKQEKKAAEGIINPAAVDPKEAVKDENTARAAIVSTQEAYTQSARETAYQLALAGGGAAMYIKDPVSQQWVPNVGPGKPYATKEEADAAAKYYIERAKDGYINGTLSEDITPLMENMETKYRNLQAAQQRVNKVEAMFAPQTAQLASTLKEESGGNTQLAQDFVRAYIADNDLPGADAARAVLVQKYGPDWKNGMGIKELKTTGGTGGAGVDPGLVINAQNLRGYMEASKKLKANPTLSTLVQAKDLEYQRTQSVPVGYEVTLNTSKPELQREAEKRYSSIAASVASLNSSSDKGDANNILKFLEGKGVEQNTYSHYLNPITHEGTITIRRGTEMATMKVPESVILQHWPETNTFSAFREKFQVPLDLNNGISTDVGGAQGGFATAFKANQGSTSPYVVKYHVNSTGNGQYNLRWWVAKNPGNGQPVQEFFINGETIGEKYGIPSNMSEEQVMSVINQMKQKDWVEKTVLLNAKLKK